MLTVAVMVLVRYSETPVVHGIGPLVAALNMIDIIGACLRVVDSFPSIGQLVVVTLADALGPTEPVHGIQPGGCSRIVVHIEYPIANSVVCLLPAGGQ